MHTETCARTAESWIMNNPWDAITPPSTDLNARRIDHTHHLDFFWARDGSGNYLFVYEFPSAETLLPAALPDLTGIHVALYQGEESTGRSRFVLRLKERSRWEMFFSLCTDLVQATRNAVDSPAAVQALLRRLAHWQDFLKRIRPDILPEEVIEGLVGELTFIRAHLAPFFGTGQAVVFWQGPEGLPQDFSVNNSAIEVKSQSGATAPRVRIASAEQLCPQLPEMYLFVVTMGKASPDTTGAVNLPLLVCELRKDLESEGSGCIDRFNDLLHMIGYVDSDRYIDFSYVLTERKMYRVSAGFPRICPDDVHPGIERLSYSVRLSECEPFRGCPDWMEV